MNAFYGLFAVFGLVLIALFGVGAGHMYGFFGVLLPYVAFIIFIAGFAARVMKWGKSPVPFNITTTGGQQESLDWIQQNKWDNPSTTRGMVMRMLLEVLLFRSLFRNTSVKIHKDDPANPVVAYNSAKLLWLFAILFHYSFLAIIVRHMRLFTATTPFFVEAAEFLDGILQIAQPNLYITDVLILAGLGFLLIRRLVNPQMRYLSLAADYFPLFLILGIAGSGVYMRYFENVNIPAIKQLTMGLATFNFSGVDYTQISPVFFVHLFLVCALLAYFPFSKLMHMGGVFMSPSRNLPNNCRAVRHENPWNPRIKPHSYAAYEDEFREPMIEAGLPVDKEA